MHFSIQSTKFSKVGVRERGSFKNPLIICSLIRQCKTVDPDLNSSLMSCQEMPDYLLIYGDTNVLKTQHKYYV